MCGGTSIQVTLSMTIGVDFSACFTSLSGLWPGSAERLGARRKSNNFKLAFPHEGDSRAALNAWDE